MLAKALEQNETPDMDNIVKSAISKKAKQLRLVIISEQILIDMHKEELQKLESGLPKPVRRNLRLERIEAAKQKILSKQKR